MHRARFAALLAVVVTACRTIHGAPPVADPIAITHTTVITGAGVILHDATIVVQGSRIAALGPGAAVAIPPTATRIDGAGKYVLPGLWDMHVHLVLEGRGALSLYVNHGVTGVRDMGGRFEIIRQFRTDIASGNIVGPRILAAGPQIESPASLAGILSTASKSESTRASVDRVVVPDVATARRVVDSLATLGVNLIKGRTFADVDVYWEIARRTHRHGLSLAGHAPFGLTIDPDAFADSGNESLEHWYYPGNLDELPDSQYHHIVRAWVRRGSALVPTLGAWRQHRFTYDSLRTLLQHSLQRHALVSTVAPSLLEHWDADLKPRRTEQGGLEGWNRVLDQFARNVGRLRAAGTPVLAGSDLPFARFPGEALQDELVYLVREAGLTPQQVIEGATRQAAEWLHLQDSLGTVGVGKVADLVILDADPLADIENVRRVHAVMIGGRWIRVERPDR